MSWSVKPAGDAFRSRQVYSDIDAALGDRRIRVEPAVKAEAGDAARIPGART